VERDGKPVAVILSLPAYERLQGQKQLADEERQVAANAFGMWANRSDIDDDWLVNGRSRWQSDWTDE
jgi:PHD/YefM family antitoxin component YafN of YafNO toxin-antitoxin module